MFKYKSIKEQLLESRRAVELPQVTSAATVRPTITVSPRLVASSEITNRPVRGLGRNRICLNTRQQQTV